MLSVQHRHLGSGSHWRNLRTWTEPSSSCTPHEVTGYGSWQSWNTTFLNLHFIWTLERRPLQMEVTKQAALQNANNGNIQNRIFHRLAYFLTTCHWAHRQNSWVTAALALARVTFWSLGALNLLWCLGSKHLYYVVRCKNNSFHLSLHFPTVI